MLTVDEALAAILERAEGLAPRSILIEKALGLVLAEDVRADLDLPPFPKALMDGFAVRSIDVESGKTRLKVIERIFAGQMPSLAIGPGETSEIMTGAPLPDGADAVVIVEHSTLDGEFVLLVEPGGIHPGRNMMKRGREMRRGDVVLKSSTRLTPLSLGVLASVGRSHVTVFPKPFISIIPTGDELVEPDQTPGPGQIRNSNATTLRALVQSRGFEAEVQPIARDDTKSLKAGLTRGLEAEVLLISGGVSAGKLDLVPDTLAELGVACVFHKVRIKPGKPIWFGVGPKRGERPGTLVFGLPGNPMSSVVGFVLFVREALDRMAGIHHPERYRTCPLPLLSPFHHVGDRPTYHPGRPVSRPSRGVELLAWSGSADLRGASYAEGLVIFPAGDREFLEGEIVDYLPCF